MVLEFKWAIIIVFNELSPEIGFFFVRACVCAREWRILFFSILPELNPCSDKAQIGVELLQLDALT